MKNNDGIKIVCSACLKEVAIITIDYLPTQKGVASLVLICDACMHPPVISSSPQSVGSAMRELNDMAFELRWEQFLKESNLS